MNTVGLGVLILAGIAFMIIALVFIGRALEGPSAKLFEALTVPIRPVFKLVLGALISSPIWAVGALIVWGGSRVGNVPGAIICAIGLVLIVGGLLLGYSIANDKLL